MKHVLQCQYLGNIGETLVVVAATMTSLFAVSLNIGLGGKEIC
jgi:hypothetical protein